MDYLQRLLDEIARHTLRVEAAPDGLVKEDAMASLQHAKDRYRTALVKVQLAEAAD